MPLVVAVVAAEAHLARQRLARRRGGRAVRQAVGRAVERREVHRRLEVALDLPARLLARRLEAEAEARARVRAARLALREEHRRRRRRVVARAEEAELVGEAGRRRRVLHVRVPRHRRRLARREVRRRREVARPPRRVEREQDVAVARLAVGEVAVQRDVGERGGEIADGVEDLASRQLWRWRRTSWRELVELRGVSMRRSPRRSSTSSGGALTADAMRAESCEHLACARCGVHAANSCSTRNNPTAIAASPPLHLPPSAFRRRPCRRERRRPPQFPRPMPFGARWHPDEAARGLDAGFANLVVLEVMSGCSEHSTSRCPHNTRPTVCVFDFGRFSRDLPAGKIFARFGAGGEAAHTCWRVKGLGCGQAGENEI